ncbi:MAG: hypothetical protein QOH55_2350 [Microbacteriaceae bacterium]|jgi:hypothetical protein|nr:hypothetical protein [Microbacteriaceae bacterium]MDQ1608889.1 hypothetical protein [Microbacteriaceae bacterium]
MTQEPAAVASPAVLEPHGHLFTTGIIAILALTTPVFAVLYWLAIPAGLGAVVLVIHLLSFVVSIIAVVAYFGTTIQIGPDGVRERGFFGRVTTTRADQVGQVLLLDLYQGSTLDTHPQLFIRAHDGRLLLRMRGQYWSRESMEQVAEELDIPVTLAPHSMTLAELRRKTPELLYWFERFPRLGRS